MRPTFTRSMSGMSRARQGFRSQMPLIKTMALTVVFGSAVVEATKNRKELEAYRKTYEFRLSILRDIEGKLQRGEPVDINQELKVVNTLTKHRYNTTTDIELDEQLEEFLNRVESEIEADTLADVVGEKPDSGSVVKEEPKLEATTAPSASSGSRVDSSKFL